MTEDIPLQAGSYALLLSLDRVYRLEIGRLGEREFQAGDYVYLGSARGPGGLQARLRHHLARSSRPHWHIDHLRRVAEVRGIVFRVSVEDKLECAWTQQLVQAGGKCPVARFGASDCRQGCEAHLVFFSQLVTADWVRQVIANYKGQNPKQILIFK
jgi:Uri superfamily endonuclease